MLCFPHTLHNCGKHINLPVLEEFMTPWLQLVCNPGAAKLRWKGVIGGQAASYSKVRWWSRWEVMKEIALNFGAVPQFLADLEADDIGDATTIKMIEMIRNQRSQLELELATIMSCENLCRATYRLEGDGLELLLVHRILEELLSFGRRLGNDAASLPSVAALLRKKHKIALGTKLREWYPAPHSKWFEGTVTRMPTAAKETYQVSIIHSTIIQNLAHICI
jgi:hypothetical protein